MKTSALSAACIALGLLAAPAAEAALISVDLESSYPGEGTAFSGVESGAAAANSAFGAANVWNVLGTTGLKITNYGSGNLVDSTGAGTTVKFSISGLTGAYGSNSFSTNTLLRDYFYWNERDLSSSIGWQLSGLVASTTYAFYTYGSFSNASSARQYRMLVDTNGDGLLTDETATTVQSTAAGTGVLVFVTTDANGVLHGQNTAVSGEANWGGFQLALASPVVTPPTGAPEPGSAALALLALGLLGATPAFRKRASDRRVD